MTRSSASYTSIGGTLANYKGFQGTVSAQLNAVLTRTADTGQVNWNTIASEPTVTRDYEVFAFADSLQATKPIFVRFDYVGGTATNKIIVTVGSTTDGAGNLGGITIPGAFTHSFTPTSSTRYAYASSDGSYLMLAYNISTGAGTVDCPAAVVIERTRNMDGTINGDGYMCWRWLATTELGSAATNYFAGTTARIFAGGTQPATVFDYGAWIPNIAGSSSFFSGDTAYAFPVYGWAPMPQGASKALLMGIATDFPRDSEVTLNHYGTDMTFFALGASSAAHNIAHMLSGTAAAVKAIYSPLFRWE